MGKLVFWILVGVVIFGFARFMAIVQRRQAAAQETNRQRELSHEDMLQCAHCGVYFPADEAVRDGDRVYCSAEHRALK